MCPVEMLALAITLHHETGFWRFNCDARTSCTRTDVDGSCRSDFREGSQQGRLILHRREKDTWSQKNRACRGFFYVVK